MSGDRVLLLELRERTSAAGNVYLSGWLGRASVVGFRDRESSEVVWQLYVSTPAPKGDQPTSGKAPATSSASSSPFMPRSRPPRRSGSRSLPPGEIDDDVFDL